MLVYRIVLVCIAERGGKQKRLYTLERDGRQVCKLVQGGKLEQMRESVHDQC